MSIFIGVDVGGTTSTICIGDAQGQLSYISPQFPTRSVEGPVATIDDIAAQIVSALAERGRDLHEVEKVTIATPGPATIDGVLSRSPNLSAKAWDQCPIRELLQEKLRGYAQQNDKVDVAKGSTQLQAGYLGDGQAAALGEFAMRRGDVTVDDQTAVKMGIATGKVESDLHSLFMVAVGTGLGGGEVRNGSVVQGAAGRAGHAGHIMLPVDVFRYEHDRTLKVGNAFNTVESAVSLTALTHQLAYRLGLPQWKDHPLHQVEGTHKDRAKRLRELAADGDALALELFDDQATALGVGLLSIQYIGDYDELVIGGGVCDITPEMKDRYLTGVKKAFHERALDGFRNFDRIVFSRCGDQASVIGAFCHAIG